jgi:hypothetical protein
MRTRLIYDGRRFRWLADVHGVTYPACRYRWQALVVGVTLRAFDRGAELALGLYYSLRKWARGLR